MALPPTLAEIHAAHDRIRPHIHRTPVLRSATIDRRAGGSVYFKCENFQRAGAFKFRGAANAVFGLADEDARRGVVTHSSGNHAGALALAGRMRGIAVHVVMPSNAPRVKKDATQGYGAQITFCAPNLAAREAGVRAIVARTGAGLVHPFDDPRIVAGQATACLELLEEVPDLDFVLAPVGGGGLLSGTILAARGISPGVQVIGCEPANADDAYRSWRANRLLPVERSDTIADGLLTSLGELTFPIIQGGVAEIVLVTEEEIKAAFRLVIERMKIVIEPSAAVAVAPLLTGKVSLAGRKAGVILSGGNVDFWPGQS